jgi:aminoglycoside phosphotransferase (APT) family kinase protein
MPIPAPRDLSAARDQLTEWLAKRHPGATDVRLSEVSAPAFTGFSNETLLFDAGWTLDGERHELGIVARVKPTAYTVFLESEFETQYRVMELLGSQSDVMVPKVLGYEADPSWLGAPFFVMEKVDGRIPTDTPPYHTGGWMTDITPDERASIWWSGLEAMSAIHRLDWRRLGLEFLDNPQRGGPGLEQQLAYYEEYFAWAREGDANPVAEAGLAWIKDHLPAAEPLALCWGDARIGNMIFRDGRCVAVLDWEMVTLGNPVQDLAWWLFLDRHHSDGQDVPRLEGFPPVAETVARWESLTGYTADEDQLRFYEIFAAFRFAVIMQRLIRMVVEFELLPPDTDQGVNNTVTRLLADSLGIPRPGV